MIRTSSVVALAVALALPLVPAQAAPRVQAAPTVQPAAQAGDQWWPPAAPSQLVVTTEGGAEVVSKDDYIDATVTLDGVTHVTEIKGRGNSTWGWAKKPYKLKLAEDAALVGDQPFDEWVLLAGYADRSALRTAAAFAIASHTSLRWTPKFRFVDVVMNGQPRGLYMLTEQVEVGEGRVDLPDDGFLLEINQRYLRDDEPGFRTRRGTPVAFKDPDEVTRRQRRTVRRAVRELEDVLYRPGFADRRTGYPALVDVRSAIDWYLVQELFRNQDSNFQSSVHISWEPGGRFRFGPAWDFDLSAGTRFRGQDGSEGWHTRLGRHWISRMLEDPTFSARVKSRWARLRPVVEQVVGQVPAVGATLAPSAQADWQLWHTDGRDLPWSVHASDYAGEVDFVRTWLTERTRWLSTNEVRFGADLMRTQERDRTVWVPVELQSPAARTMSVDYRVVTSTATPGLDVEPGSGRVQFDQGQRLRYIPVRILSDTLIEGTETLVLELHGAPSDLVVGSPSTVRIKIDPVD
ncbi:MAG TPA: CotH kinase family protein [Nocardioides sp.]|nr:CotH kinase family protein [Nocardioides sp.]